MTRTKLSLDQEQKLIINCIVNTAFLKQIYPNINTKIFKTTYSKTVWSWISEYYKEYNKSPGRDIQTIYKNKSVNFNESDDDKDNISIFLSNLSKKYESFEDINLDFEIDVAINYINEKNSENILEIEDPQKRIEEIIKFKLISKECTKTIFTRIGDIECKPIQWQIKDIIVENTTVEIFGETGCTKTFITLDLALSIAAKIDFHDKKVVHYGPVLYLCGEGEQGINRRCKAWAIEHDIDLKDIPFFIMNAKPQLNNDKDISTIKTALEEINKNYGTPALLVVDTWNRLSGIQENDNSEAAQVINNLDKLREPYGMSCIIVHHTGIADKTRGRGASSLKAAVDNEYKVERDKNGIITFTGTKERDNEKVSEMTFELVDIDLGFEDEFGNMVRKAVIRSTKDYTKIFREELLKGKNQKTAFNLLGKEKMLVEDWRYACLEAGMVPSRYADVKRILLEKGKIAIEGNYVYRSV